MQVSLDSVDCDSRTDTGAQREVQSFTLKYTSMGKRFRHFPQNTMLHVGLEILLCKYQNMLISFYQESSDVLSKFIIYSEYFIIYN